ncbi:hypothetical protein GCM10011348_39520 [Marinobacterium nitratireducens]|uniref:Hemerythrin-like domain-containing protein n=1 Tax=Marinobacterium nitratireducens TaxID=518897 RepID=A0A917ZPI6_9GAMM|nr:hemerythrin domain-containing protein [Marinobacterium nitratireducens]GGO87105.1 hypothetical protein GCM10011348_39520 [Marinobacterium nitratireducens]
MKRFEALKPLSRDHHRALSVAAKIARCADGELGDCWASLEDSFIPSLQSHFDEEERWLLPLLGAEPGLRRRLLSDHRELRDLMAAKAIEARRAFADRLKAHVRFEEQELFEWLQRAYGADGLLTARGKGNEAH